MTFSVRHRLGSYEVLSPLGAGGMGEVYRARDTKLGREVAIKVLPEAFASDLDRIARFEREAKVLASLNHPHIAVLHGMEQADDRHFLIMELVEGETLAERLQRGPLQVEDALNIARQIAEALEAAHEKGIVHRDLKPANVQITPDEKVKVLDFGLAKAMEPAGVTAADISQSPTLSMMATQAGVILGTAAYMSPEQARGIPADHRSDVFSVGCEAHLLTSLNHPHIAAIYGLEEANGSQFLVLELVEGETLAERLKSGPLPVPEALNVARQIADALQAAHEKGIIHRDLKPANIAFFVMRTIL